MVVTVTGLGGQGGERRQPRLGGSNPEDASYFRRRSPAVGGILPDPSTEIAAPQDAKLSVLAPEPSEQLRIMASTSETRH